MKRSQLAKYPNPKQKAEGLAESLVSRSSSQNLPPNTLAIQQRLSNQRWQLINTACQTPVITDTPFALKELYAAQHKSKDIVTGADKIAYSVISNMDQEGENALLHVVNRILTQQHRP